MPDSPIVSQQSLKISVCAVQNDTLCTKTLQLSPADSFTLIVQVSPKSLEEQLFFAWIKKTEILEAGLVFETDTSSVPDSLLVLDDFGNRKTEALHFIFDSAPQMSAETIPAEGDTLYGDSTTAFRFAYSSIDADKGDVFSYSVELDSVLLNTGSLTEFYQSGFRPGKHRFRIFVQDEFGLKDSTDWISFFVAEGE